MQCAEYNIENEFDEELNIDFKKIFFTVWSRKSLIIKVFSCILIFFVLLTFVLPKKYKVEADLYINKTNNSNLMEFNPYVLEELGAGAGMTALTGGSMASIMNELEILQSPLVMDKVIRENDLRITKKWGIIPNRKEGEYISTKSFLKKNINIENKKGTNVVTIEYKSKKPDLSYNVVCSIIANYVNVMKDLHSEKAKSDTKILEAEYNKVKDDLQTKVNNVRGLPQTAMTGTGNLAAMSAFSSSASQALSSIQGQFITGTKSQIAVQEETAKMTQLATKLQWAKMVEEMSDSSKVLVLKEPVPLRDFENSSPKLLINIILGIVFGLFASLFAVVFAELTDKKLSYSKLGSNALYKNNKNIIDIKKFLLQNRNKQIVGVEFEDPGSEINSLISEYTNVSIVKADISEEFANAAEKGEALFLIVKIGQTDAELYKFVKETAEMKNKPVLKEILV